MAAGGEGHSSTAGLAGQTLRGPSVCLSAAGKFKCWVCCQLLQGPPGCEQQDQGPGGTQEGKNHCR